MTIEPQNFTEQRNDALREGVKGLLIINGGGATAMLAFLPAIWTKKPEVANYVVWCIASFAVGLFLAGIVQFLRYHASFAFQAGKTCAFKTFRTLYLGVAYLSLVAFLIGVVVVVVGMLSAKG